MRRLLSAIPGKTLIRIILVIVWVVLLGALLKRDYFIETLNLREARVIQRGREESFLGIYFQDERIGYVKNRLSPADGDRLYLVEDAFLRLNILDQDHPVRMQVRAELGRDLLLKNFTFQLTSPFYRMTAQGTVQGRNVLFQLDTGKEVINDTIQLAAPPFLSTNQRGYLLSRGLQPGDKLKIPYFDPVSLSGQDTVIEYQGRAKVLIHGRVHNLHRFTETFSGLHFDSWLDDEGKVMKEESPAGFVFLAEPEFKATDIPEKGREILSAVSVPVTGRMPEPGGLALLRYRLTLPADAAFDLARDRQSLADGLLTVTLETVPGPETAACAEQPAALAATPYIQTNNEMIASQAHELTQDATSAIGKVRSLAAWVYANLEKRPVLGIPDALTTLHTRMGDCNEHAALFAALARSAGIPTRVAAGVVFFQNAFYYHAWNEVCIDDRWLSLDTTRNQIPADVSHIKFVDGETAEMVRIGALLGRLQIEVLAASPAERERKQ